MLTYRTILAVIGLGLFSQLSFADKCPSVDDIKHQTLSGWQAYDSEDNTPLPPARVAELAKHVEQFALAEWPTNSKSKAGTIHCYYRDKHGSNLEAYLSKNNFKPDNGKNGWYQVSGYMHCAAGMEKCAFQPAISADSQLAKR